MRRNLIAFLMVLLVGGGAGFAYWKYVWQPGQQQRGGATGPLAGGGRAGGPGGGARGPVPVEAAEVRVAPAEVTAEAVGTLRSFESVVLKPEVAGRVVGFGFAEGRPVKAGQPMVRLDDSVERAQLAEAETALRLATANLERARELRRSSVGTQRALDEAEAQQLTAGAAVDLAKARLAKLTLRAPFDGIAGLRQVSEGAFVTAGAEIVNIERIQPLKLDFRVPEVFLPTLFDARGERRVAVAVDALPGRTFVGKVYAIDPLVDAQGRAIVVRAEVENPGNAGANETALRPGLFARVSLTLSQQAEALWVPEEAIVPQAGRQFVFKVVAGGQDGARVAKMAPVRTGARQGGSVQLVEGAERGDLVVTAGTLKLRDNVPVAVQAPAPPPPAAGPAGGGRPSASGAAPAAAAVAARG